MKKKIQKLDIRYMRSGALVFLALYNNNPTSTTMETMKSPAKTPVPALIWSEPPFSEAKETCDYKKNHDAESFNFFRRY